MVWGEWWSESVVRCVHNVRGQGGAERGADESIQDRRRLKRVPNGRALHEYVNIYFDARNPMMYRRLDLRAEVAVVRVSPAVLDLSGTVIADGNAASNVTASIRRPQG